MKSIKYLEQVLVLSMYTQGVFYGSKGVFKQKLAPKLYFNNGANV